MTDPLPTQLDHYRLLGRSGLRVSPLCLGTMTFGTDWGWGSDRDTSRAIFDRYVEAGGNFIDTANFYTNGTSESMLADFIAAERERLVVATKYTLNMKVGDPNAGGNHRKNMVQAVEASLKRLKTDYIDLYWLHAWDYTTPVDEVMRAFDDLVRAGKVLYIGSSDMPAWKVSQCNTMAELMGWTRFVALQIVYSLTKRDVERDLVPMGVELGLGVLPWSPLDGGVLTGKYSREDIEKAQARREGGEDPFDSANRMVNLTEEKLRVVDELRNVATAIERTPAQVALNWLLTRPGVVSPIIGARTMNQLEDNLASLDFAIPNENLQRLNKVSRIELGFPHDFLVSPGMKRIIHGNAEIDIRIPGQ